MGKGERAGGGGASRPSCRGCGLPGPAEDGDPRSGVGRFGLRRPCPRGAGDLLLSFSRGERGRARRREEEEAGRLRGDRRAGRSRGGERGCATFPSQAPNLYPPSSSLSLLLSLSFFLSFLFLCHPPLSLTRMRGLCGRWAATCVRARGGAGGGGGLQRAEPSRAGPSTPPLGPVSSDPSLRAGGPSPLPPSRRVRPRHSDLRPGLGRLAGPRSSLCRLAVEREGRE